MNDFHFWWENSPSEADTAIIPAEELNRLAIEQCEDAGGNE